MRKHYQSIIRSILPTIAFMMVYKLSSYKHALVVGLVIGIIVYSNTYRKNNGLKTMDKIGVFSLIASSIMGLIATNPIMYFVYPLIQNAFFMAIMFGSLLFKSDVVSLIAKDYVDEEDRESMRPTYRKLTLMWGIYFLVRTSVKAIGIMSWSFELLYTVNWILGTPVGIALVWYSFNFPNVVYKKMKLDNEQEVLNP